MKYDLAILVVLYNSELEGSKTINSLKKITNIDNVKIIIWNNGPKLIKEKENFTIVNTIDNISLAKIYNSFLNMCDAENYLFFDHDTIVSKENLTNLIENSFKGITLPKVYNNNIVVYPFYEKGIYPFSKKTISIDDEIINDGRLILSITSGLSIHNSIIEKTKTKFNDFFDERFKLYGVDTSFFLRSRTLKIPVKITGSIYHSLSRLTSENSGLTKFREKERAIDAILILVNYPSLRTFVRAVKFFIKKNRLLKYYKYIFFCLKNKKHPNKDIH